MEAFYRETQVWDTFETAAASQHVYGLTTAPDDSVLVFTEARIEWTDTAPHHLAMKRGTRTPSGIQWSDTVFLERGDDGTCWANPAAVTDRKAGHVFFFYVINLGGEEQNATRVFYRRSDDNGLTWSDRCEITDLFENDPHGWTFHMPGPGHGIQLAHQPDASRNGRLLMQFWHRRGIHETPRKYGVSLLASDDHGETWRRAGTPGPVLNMNESRLAEMGNGQIVLNARGQDADGENTHTRRIVATSDDAGESFATPTPCPDFTYCGCDSGMLWVTENGEESLLMSHLAHPTKRETLTLSQSRDLGKSWEPVATPNNGPCQYSDLCAFLDGTLGLLYGAGGVGKQPTRFAHFSIDWLRNPTVAG